MKVDRLKERSILKELKDTLKCSNKITEDTYGNLEIIGKRGKLYTDEVYWYIYLSNIKIPTTKKLLSFMQLWQEGDFELVFRLDRRNLTNTEITKIRKIVGFKKKRTLSPENRAKLIEQGTLFRFKHGATKENNDL